MSRTLTGASRRQVRMMLVVPALALAYAAAGCGGDSDEVSAPLQSGVYTYEISAAYMLENGGSEALAESDSGTHTVTLGADGTFVDSWRTTARDRTGTCRGTYEEGETSRVTFTWTSSCSGDWEATYEVAGDTVTWSDAEALPPLDADEDQKAAELFSSVPWTRTGDVPDK